MDSLPQLQRDLGEVEAQLQFTRARLACYQARDEPTLATHTRQVVAGLEGTRQALLARVAQLDAAHAN